MPYSYNKLGKDGRSSEAYKLQASASKQQSPEFRTTKTMAFELTRSVASYYNKGQMEPTNIIMLNQLDVLNSECMLKGNRMQAYVRKPCIPKHDVWLAENKSLIVRKASLGANIRTIDGEVCDTYRDVCYKRGLLDDDNEYIEAIEEASHTASGYYLRSLFATMLITYSLSRPDDVWEKCWHYLIDGILYKQQNDQKNPDLVLSKSQLKNLALLEIENFLFRNNCTLRCFPTMPFPDDDDSVLSSTNRFMNEELAYDTEVMTSEFERLFISLTDEQRDVYNQIIEAVDQKRGGIFFVYGYGGTGKTFLWKTLSASIRSKRKIVLNVASSGIVSLLLEGGRTAHFRFLIPINLTDDSTCSIKRNPDICNLIKKTDLIIWDEAPMIHKHAFEALDRTLKDVIKDGNRSNCQHPFGGKVIVFGGDFRQILPVVQNGSRSDIVNASLSSSHIWTKCKVLRLTKNMRLTVGCQSSNSEDTIRFAEWLLELGEGKLGGDNDGNAIIEIPGDLLIRDSNDPISDLIDFVYPALLERCNDISYFQERAILAPLNEVVEEINDRFLSIFPGEEIEYLSSDSLDNSESVGPGFDSALHSPDFLNDHFLPELILLKTDFDLNQCLFLRVCYMVTCSTVSKIGGLMKTVVAGVVSNCGNPV
ncbi:uncharacterized protein LOC143558810 [Bidens hawaiensis]|uniref:uncharacterized protein LOC143558810 n=1 Tax=Bidens hawaiensis TaxID=980011 RepID=UPI00404B96A3